MSTKPSRDISIWFFIGALVLCYGVLILGAGIWELARPPAHPTVLNELRPAIWWGLLLILLGGGYSYKFWPSMK